MSNPLTFKMHVSGFGSTQLRFRSWGSSRVTL